MKTVFLYVIGIDPGVRWKPTSTSDSFKGEDSSFLEEKAFFQSTILSFFPPPISLLLFT